MTTGKTPQAVVSQSLNHYLNKNSNDSMSFKYNVSCFFYSFSILNSATTVSVPIPVLHFVLIKARQYSAPGSVRKAASVILGTFMATPVYYQSSVAAYRTTGG